MNDKIADAVEMYTGYNIGNNTWLPEKLAAGWMPYIATSLITRGIQKLSGIIRGL